MSKGAVLTAVGSVAAAALVAIGTVVGVYLGNQNAVRVVDRQAAAQARLDSTQAAAQLKLERDQNAQQSAERRAGDLLTAQRASATLFVADINKYALDLELKTHVGTFVGVTAAGVSNLLNSDHQAIFRSYAGMAINWSNQEVLNQVYTLSNEVNSSIVLSVGKTNRMRVLAAQSAILRDTTRLVALIRIDLN